MEVHIIINNNKYKYKVISRLRRMGWLGGNECESERYVAEVAENAEYSVQ